MSRFAVIVAVAVLGCRHDPPPPPVASDVRFVKLFSRGADDTSPLLVVVHGRGDTADHFAQLWRDFPARLEIAVAEAPTPYEHGREWYSASRGMSDRELAAGISDAEARLWPAIAALAHGRKIWLAGFSQGANLTYFMATRHPDAIAYAFPISGHLPLALVPPAGTHLAPIYALHGTDDPVIAIGEARDTVAALQAVGGTAELHELSGVGHAIGPAMLEHLVNHLAPLVPAPR